MSNIMLKEIYIDNFKSFHKSKFEFGKVNCLIAPNNTGKSNLFDALNFLNDLMYKNIINAISRIGIDNLTNYHYENNNNIIINAKFDIENIVLVGDKLIKYDIELMVLFNLDLDLKQYNIDTIINGKLKSIDVYEEDFVQKGLFEFNMKIYDKYIHSQIKNYDKYKKELTKKRYFKFNLSHNNIQNTCVINANSSTTILVKRLFSLRFLKNELVTPFAFSNIFNSISLLNSHYFDINEIKKPEMTGEKSLSYNGKNLVEFLDFLNTHNTEVFEDISTSLIGEVELIDSISINDSSFVPELIFREDVNGKKYNVSLKDISDGTVHFIAIMSALYGNEDAVSILIEEPERHMHMKVLSYILNTMRDDDKQIFFTTHSTEMLSELELDEIVFMFRDFDGDTKGQRAKDIPYIKDFMKRYKNDLVEMIQCGIVGEYEE